MGEIWALKPALQFALLERLAARRCALSLHVSDQPAPSARRWETGFEAVSPH